MKVLSTKGWQDYELLDSGYGQRLERFGKYIISRPDPQVIWKPNLNQDEWEKADAIFKNDGWEKKTSFPDKWELSYNNLKFFAKLTPFKHTGVFPEQVLNWQFIQDKINLWKDSGNKQINILNLFGYTGISSLACAANGAKVTHLDGSKPSITWARENQQLSGLSDKPIRWILDDALTFTKREATKGNIYDGIIMDPPVYGHGPNGEIWNFNKSFPELLQNCKKILSENPLFVIVNAYAISSSSLMLSNMLEDYLNLNKAKIEYGELALEESNRDRLLSTGIFARYSLI